eukprot:3053619-Prymnesium_polylepis.3
MPRRRSGRDRRLRSAATRPARRRCVQRSVRISPQIELPQPSIDRALICRIAVSAGERCMSRARVHGVRAR